MSKEQAPEADGSTGTPARLLQKLRDGTAAMDWPAWAEEVAHLLRPPADSANGAELTEDAIRALARRHRLHVETHNLASNPVQIRRSISGWEDNFVAFCRELVAGHGPVDASTSVPAGKVDDAEVMRMWRAAGLRESFLGNGGTNDKLVRFAELLSGRGNAAEPDTEASVPGRESPASLPTELEAFEIWARDKHWRLDKLSNGMYLSEDTAAGWYAWRERGARCGRGAEK